MGFENHKAGGLDVAERHYRRALKRDKKNPDVLFLLGTLLYQQGDLKRSEKTLRLAQAERPSHPETLYNLARVFMDMSDFQEAENLLLETLRLQPENVSALRNLGVTLLRAYRPGDARPVLEKAIALDPSAPEPWCDLGLALSQLGVDQGSEEAFEKALERDNTLARARHYLGHLQLRQQRFSEGWPNYEARLLDPLSGVQQRPLDCPVWQGEDLTGKTILVWGEQGLGDQILHASMIPDLSTRAARVVIECEPRLAPLFARSFPRASVVSGATHSSSPAAAQADYQTAIGSLGRWLRQDRECFAAPQSYLSVHPDGLVTSSQTPKPRIGLSWKSARVDFGAQKSTDLMVDWSPVFEALPDAEYYSVQYGDVRADIDALQAQQGVAIVADPGVDVTRDIDGLGAFLTSLDLLITTSNTTAHLAGALGLPVWCLVPNGPGRLWYWFDGEQSSLWYPAMTLYWQKSAGNWKDVFDCVAADLRTHPFSD